jgi:hypothetical protein
MRASYLLANLFIVVKVFARDGNPEHNLNHSLSTRDPQSNSIDINVIKPFDDNGNHTLIGDSNNDIVDDNGNHNSTIDDNGKHNSTSDDSGHHNSSTDDSGHHNSSTDDSGHHNSTTDDSETTTDDSTTVPTEIAYATAASNQNANINNGVNTIKSSLLYVFLGAFVAIFS